MAALPLAELVARSDKVRRRYAGGDMDLCSIMNAKSGACNQDCAFCAQSGRHAAQAPVYPLKGSEEILEQARRARAIGAGRFDIVASGDNISRDELRRIAGVIAEIRDTVGIALCASLGTVDEDGFRMLKSAGLTRYHHNIETSPRYFPRIVTTHTFQDRVRTIKAAKRAGLEVCSGGIIGLGETMDDRIEMALILKDLDVDSVPLNVLVPIKGTPLGSQKQLSCVEVIRTIALFRIILRDKTIKIAAGRESALKDFQAMAFMAGANGMLIGGYLTIKGRSVEDDRRLVDEVRRLWQGPG